DRKGSKIRGLPTPIEMAMLSGLGATGVPMPLGEVLAALQQGALDGSESALTVFTTFKYFDVVKYYANTNHYFITSIATVSKKWFDGVPADVQKIVVEEGRAVHAELLEWGKEFNRNAVTIWKEKTKDGYVELAPDQRAAFRARMEGVDAKVASDVPGGTYDASVAVAVLGASRRVYAAALGCAVEELRDRWIRAAANPITPVVIKSAGAPVKEEIQGPKEVGREGFGLDEFPVPI